MSYLFVPYIALARKREGECDVVIFFSVRCWSAQVASMYNASSPNQVNDTDTV